MYYIDRWFSLSSRSGLTPMIESLRTTQIAFFRFATLCGFFRGSPDEVQKVSVQGVVQEKLIWNHLWEHRFSVPDPRVFPPRETTFWHRRPKAHFMTGRTGSPVKRLTILVFCVFAFTSIGIYHFWRKPDTNRGQCKIFNVTVYLTTQN